MKYTDINKWVQFSTIEKDDIVMLHDKPTKIELVEVFTSKVGFKVVVLTPYRSEKEDPIVRPATHYIRILQDSKPEEE